MEYMIHCKNLKVKLYYTLLNQDISFLSLQCPGIFIETEYIFISNVLHAFSKTAQVHNCRFGIGCIKAVISGLIICFVTHHCDDGLLWL